MTDPLRQLSPVRNTTHASRASDLAREQLVHFGIYPASEHGRVLGRFVEQLYGANVAVHELWSLTQSTLGSMDLTERTAWFNAKRFACFQLAKILDTLQNPLRATYQSLIDDMGAVTAKGPYPLFDNVAALFSATPVITRTATYVYACTEWVEDAFQGREPLHEIYSRLLNPTSISLANHIVDLEAGPDAAGYLAWNFNSGMAAIDATLANLVGHRDVVLASRNVYGGTYQLLHDWYGKRSNLDVAIEWFDGEEVANFVARLTEVEARHADRLAAGRRIYVYVESPSNPHGYVLDVPGICAAAHARGITVICDATVATPFLQPVLRRGNLAERPDFVIHSYTKDLCGSGTTTAGVVIGRAERMFLPKGTNLRTTGHDGVEREYRWDETLFWNVYYVKGAFLDADKAFEVLSGMRTAELRILSKCIHTIVLARTLALHPMVNVRCNVLEGDRNHALARRCLRLGLPAPLFTVDFEGNGATAALPREQLKRFMDSLEPGFGLQVSLGQMNSLVLCPALTSHSELSEPALRAAGISPSTVRISVGDEDPRLLVQQLARAAAVASGRADAQFAAGFPDAETVGRIYEEVYLEVHRRWMAQRRSEWRGG